MPSLLTTKSVTSTLVARLVAALVLVGTAAPLLAAEARWEKLDDSDGVETYAMPPDADGVVGMKGIAVLDAPAAAIAEAMKDNATAARWMPMVGERYDLKVFSPDHRIEYTHMKMPWPATDRYYVNEARRIALPNGDILLTVESVEPEAAWLNPKMVLASFRRSEFRLQPLADGRTRLDFEVRTSAGGSLPAWLVSMGQKSWPHDFVVGLRGELTRRESEARVAMRSN